MTGKPGTGPSNIRRWLFEKDVIDCIVKFPESIFFRTGINTYLWILNSAKPEERKGLIQLIDASDRKTSMRKNQGNKRYEINEKDRQWIIETYIDGHDHGNSVLVPYETFMFRQVTTQRPLRAKIHIPAGISDTITKSGKMEKLDDSQFVFIADEMAKCAGKDFPYTGMGVFDDIYEQIVADYTEKHPAGFTKAGKPKKVHIPIKVADIEKWVSDNYLIKDPAADIVYDKNGAIVPDPDLTDTENIPFGTAFEDYMESEVLPYAPETWIDETVLDKGTLPDGKVGVVGTNISFNKFFYHYEEPRKPEEIAKEIMELECGLEEFMKEFLI